MKKSLLAIAAALSLAGCASIPGSELITTSVAAVSDALTGPDTDYKNYLSHCRTEVNAQRDVAKADAEALTAALSKGNDKTQYGATLIMAFKAGQGGPKIGCTVARKKGNMELLLGESDLLDAGLRLYEINRSEKRFSRQLAADKELARERFAHDRQMADRQNDLLTTLSGDKIELTREANRASEAAAE